jgi:hypothetical protein
MDEKMICPFCGKEIPTIYPWMTHEKETDTWRLSHFCDVSDPNTISIYITGKTKKEVINRLTRNMEAK